MKHDLPPPIDASGLRARRPEPSERVRNKEISHIDPICRRIIAASPFLLLSTVRSDGLPDISPRGDAPGFVRVRDEHTLLLPDRAGNNRLDSFVNLATNPALGLLFLIPGHGDMLRLRGRGVVRDDPDLIALFPGPRPPDLVLEITVTTAFLHCSRATVRAGLWRPEAWPDRSDVPSLAEAVKAHCALEQSVEEIATLMAGNDLRVLGEEGIS
ncbi:MAG: pyridoxamine 5'-phosphate oxidase family protein [Rhodobacteraceae bacterium]|nr:pyridoxamine 5'-phosphate oxidase family protein [Paracoccaceae bacterium]